MRKRAGLALERRPGHKPEVDDMRDDEAKRILAKGYDGLRAGIRDGAHRHEDQDEDGVAAEFLYPGFFGLFAFENTELLVACQKNYNDWLHDYASAARGRLFGLAALPVQDPPAAVAELQRVIKMGFKGGCIPCSAPPGEAVQGRMLRADLVAGRGSGLSARHCTWAPTPMCRRPTARKAPCRRTRRRTTRPRRRRFNARWWI